MTNMVAVFNHNTARFFTGKHDGVASEVATMVCPEARMPGRELYSDAPSRNKGSSSAGHAFDPHTASKEKLTIEFSRKIAEWLEAARVNHDFSRLVLVAPPDMLGAVRKTLSDECRKLVVEELHKNMTHLDVKEIIESLPQLRHSSEFGSVV